MDPNISRMQDVYARQRRAFAAHPYPNLAERKIGLVALKGVLRR